MIEGTDWTWDASAAAGVTIKAAANRRIIKGGDIQASGVPWVLYNGALTLKSLTLLGNGAVDDPPFTYAYGGLIFISGQMFTATNVVFKNGQAKSNSDVGCVGLWGGSTYVSRHLLG